MLYKVLKSIIEREQTEGLLERLDVFFEADKLTQTEYTELTALLESGASA